MKGQIYLLLALLTLTSGLIPSSAIINNASSGRQRRSFKVPFVGSLFGKQEPEIPHLGKYPLWKVHRYHGISLKPVPFPGEAVPASLPVPPLVEGEAPSIVNVPDPNYAPADAYVPPHNEYSAPAVVPESVHYSAPSPPVGPYPPPVHSSAPTPSSAYSPPSAPYPPVYNAPLSSFSPRAVSTVETTPIQYNVQIGSPNAGAGSSSESSSGIGSSLGSLLNLLPPETVQRMQQYVSTPEGQERLSTLFGIAMNARKLKSSAARSLQGVFEKFFGGAGGSTDIALQSGTYTKIPDTYPAPQGILNKLRAVGTGVSGSSIPNLPEVPPLPSVPGLHALPPVPQLPHINLPEINPLTPRGTDGRYVSINLPKPVAVAQSYSVSVDTPTYGVPPKTYGVPSTYAVPVETYGTPQVPTTSYGVPSRPHYPYSASSQTSGGDSSTYFPVPQSSYGAPSDSYLAASETEEQFESLEDEDTEEGVAKVPPVPLKTTKLQRVKDTQNFQVEDVRMYLDPNHPAAHRPNYQEFQPMENSRSQADNNIAEENEG